MRSLNVALFVTCLVDFFRPSVGRATLQLLRQAGCQVTIPRAQTCCGQPFYNNGEIRHSKAIALNTLKMVESFDYVVVPSGSCAGMIRKHYPELIEEDNPLLEVCQRVYEVTSFLTDVLNVGEIKARFPRSVTYHDSCSGLRELKIHRQPRLLLKSVSDLTLTELKSSHVCCGFGGTFCVKYPEISTKMVEDKCNDIASTGATTVLGGDLGCLLNIAGRLSRREQAIETRHIAEVCAGIALETPAIGKTG